MDIDVLVCNLTRFGDLLQSQALVDALYRAGHKVGLICLENFAPATVLLRNLAKVWALPGAALMASLDKGWPQAASRLLDFAAGIYSRGTPAYVINLTPTLPARLFCRLLANHGSKVLGFGLDANGYGENIGVWASFLSVAARKRINAPFNIADMYRRLGSPIAGTETGSYRLANPPADALNWAENFLSPIKPNGGFVALQLGASEEKRRWPVKYFRALGSRLWRDAGCVPVLLGSGSEEKLGMEYAKGMEAPFINAIGKTSILQLAALLSKCRLLATNDTGTMHLAAGLGIPSISFFLATAQPWDTGPQHPGCLCLEPAIACHPCPFGQDCDKNFDCRDLIKPDTVAKFILNWLSTGKWSTDFSHAISDCRPWLTGTDSAGFVRVECFSDAVSEPRSLWMALLRDFWCQLLDEMTIFNGPPASVEPQAAVLPIPPDADKAAAALNQAANILDTLIDCGALAFKNPAAGKLFLVNCERLQTHLDSLPPLATMAEFWRELRRNDGADLAKFLPLTEILARHFRAFAKRLTPEK